MAQVDVQLAVGDVRAVPQRVGLMLQAGGCAEIRQAPLLVRRHATGHVVQLGEIRGPEIFIEVQIAVVALGRARVGAQENQLGHTGEEAGGRCGGGDWGCCGRLG